jgi:hypothetical protein
VIAQVLLALLADAVFTSAATKERVAAGELARYFAERDLAPRHSARPAPAR